MAYTQPRAFRLLLYRVYTKTWNPVISPVLQTLSSLGVGARNSAPAFCPQFNMLFVADLQPSHLSSCLHGQSEADERRLLHVQAAGPLCTHASMKLVF